MRRVLFAAALGVAALAASAQVYTCSRILSGDSFTFTCAPQAAPAPPQPPSPPVVPVDPPIPTPPTPPASNCPPNINPFICALIGAGNPAAGPPSPPAGGGSLDGFDLSPGHPKVNLLYANTAYTFSFKSTGLLTSVGYGTASGTDSGMRVTSWISDAAGRVLVAPETRVVANWQPFPVTLPAGSYQIHVQPQGTGPLMVEQQ